MSLVFAFAFVQNVWLLPIMMLITGTLFTISRIPFSFLVKRLRYPSWFILAMVSLLPFTIGQTTLWQWGQLTLKLEGCQTAILVAVRFFCIITISLVLFGTAPFLNSLKSLRSLGLPRAIVDMTLLTYRYLEEMGEMVHKMETAIKLRGFDKHKFQYRNFKILASLIGSLLVRSYERSTRIYQAMILRGYGYNMAEKNKKKTIIKNRKSYQDLGATILTLSIALGLLGLDLLLNI